MENGGNIPAVLGSGDGDDYQGYESRVGEFSQAKCDTVSLTAGMVCARERESLELVRDTGNCFRGSYYEQKDASFSCR